MRVYNMLIVDDEPYIVHTLANILSIQPNLELNFSYAYCAEEALEHMEHQKIDILMSDIQMNGMSGIDLVKTVKKRWPMCKAILVTAHTNFDYIYEGYNNDIVSYILKTESDEHIAAEVKRAIRLIEEDLNQKQLFIGNQSGIRDTMILVRRELFFSLMKSNNDLTDGEQISALKFLGYREPFENMVLVSGILQSGLSYRFSANIDQTVKSFYTVKMIMSHYITNSVPVSCCESRGQRIYWLLQSNSDIDVENYTTWLSGMLETVQQSCYKTAGISISFMLSMPVSDITMISSVYHRGNILANQLGIMRQSNSVFTYGLDKKEASEDVAFDMDNFNAKLNACLDIDESTVFMQLIDEYCNVLNQLPSCSDISFTKRYYSLALYLLRLIENRNLQSHIESRISFRDLFSPFAFDSPSAASEYLRQLCVITIEAIADEKNDFSQKAIRLAKEYIDLHIYEDISLQSIAKVTNYNISYVSRLFSKKTGETLSTYIAKQKMEYIKKLMVNESLTLNDIMIKSGFDTRSYFNRFIKRWTGLSPNNFRKKLIGISYVQNND